jgi:hypothetical protein
LLERILSVLFSAQSIADAPNCIPVVPGGSSACPASVFNSVTAAFATQGYWIQADILWYLNNTGMGTWAILIYVIAAISGLISMAMGFPPKLYLWFLIGPGIYHWLVQDTVPVLGVRWNVGPQTSDDRDRQERAQREVFRLAEAGLANASILRGGHSLAPGSITDLSGFLGNDFGKVEVSNLFLWYDTLLSDLAEWFIEWTGVFYLAGANNSILADGISSLPPEIVRTAGAIGVIGVEDSNREDDQHWSLSTLKWEYLQDITGAHLHSGDVRDAFTTFLSSECGDAFEAGLDEAAFLASATAKGANIPASVFTAPGTISQITGLPQEGLYVEATRYMSSVAMPTPKSMRSILREDGVGSFRKAFPFIETEAFREQNMFETVRCDQYLYLLVQMFRWEAGHQFYQMISGLPAGVTPATLLYTLFYGWEFRNLDGDNIFDLDFLRRIASPRTFIGQYDLRQLAAFTTDLILVHLLRNEFAIAPKPFTKRQSSSQEAIDWSRIYQATLGSKTKFGEVYTWATLLPYVQGVLLYLLAIAYPFVCLFILIPGWHKIIFTWMTFWAWVKLWDVGFAIVVVLERSVWTMLGSNTDAVRLFSRVWSMQEHGRVAIDCPQSLIQFSLSPPFGVCRPGVVPDVILSRSSDAQSLIPWFDTLRIFDKALTLGPAMDLDLANGWYIYIMSALYFAVPAVTGQIVLGAKSGAASLATQAIQGTAQEVGRSVGTSHTAQIGNLGVAHTASLGQAAYAKSMRQDGEGLGLGALQLGNRSLRGEAWKDATGVQSSALGQMSRVAGLYRDSRQDALTAGMAVLSGAATVGERALPAVANSAGSILGAFGKWASRNGGSGPLANGMNQLGNYGAIAMTAFGQASSIAQSVGSYGRNEVNRQAQILYDAQQAQAAVSGFFYGGEARGLRDSAGKYEKAAEQKASDAVWAAQRDFANQVSGYMGAQGISDPKFTPSSKAKDLTGMSFEGQMGVPFQEAARYSDPATGAYGEWLYGMTSELQSRYGGEAVADRYRPAAIGDELQYAITQGNEVWKQAFGSDGQNMSENLWGAVTGGVSGEASYEIFRQFNSATPLYTQEDFNRGQPLVAPPPQFTNPFVTPVTVDKAA